MSSIQCERITANCKTIFGDATYDLELEDVDGANFICFAREDLGTSFGNPLAMTGFCRSEEQAWRELDRMLILWARQVQSGQKMTKAQSLEIFGHGQNKALLSQVYDLMKEKGLNP